MGYFLGIDLGTTYMAAAIERGGRTEMVPLGNRAMAIPSVVCLREDGTVLVGEAAERRAATEPACVAREFKRRVGDTTPIIVCGAPYSAEALMAKLLRSVVDNVVQLEGGAPDGVAVTHPANWGAYKKDLLDQAVRMADVHDVTYLTEPEAAAAYYASTERVELGAVIAVYDLGGGTFDATVLRKTADGFEILGRPEGIERLGGIDFDEAVFQHVKEATGESLAELDPGDPSAVSAVARLRQACVEAKEALSSDTDTTVSVTLPNLHTEVRVTRAELENMVRPRLTETIDALHRALRSAGIEPDHITNVLLVGGSSRMPLVAQMVSAEIGRPVSVDAHPKHAIALGAAMTAASRFVSGGVPADSAPALTPALPAEPAGDRPERAAVADVAAGILEDKISSGSAVPPRQHAEPADLGPPLTVSTHSRRGDAPGATSEDSRPPSRGAHRTRGKGRKGFVTGLITVVLLAAVAAGTYVFVRARDTGGVAAATQTTTKQTTTTLPDIRTCGDRTPCVQIDGISIDDGQYVVDYTTFGFTESPDVEEEDHIHFYWNVNPDTGEPQSAAESGTNVPEHDRGFWVAYGGGSPFTDLAVSDRPEAATELCAVEARGMHEIAENSGTCQALPEDY